MDKNPQELWKLYYLLVGNGGLVGTWSLSSQLRGKGGRGGTSLAPCSLSPPTLSMCLPSQHRHGTGGMSKLTRTLDYLLQEVRLEAPQRHGPQPRAARYLPSAAFRRAEGWQGRFWLLKLPPQLRES